MSFLEVGASTRAHDMKEKYIMNGAQLATCLSLRKIGKIKMIIRII